MGKLTCFKAYDIRGKLGSELNEDVAYRIGRAYAQFLNAKRVVVGGDVRLTSESLKLALANGMMDGGADVIDIGMVGTEEIYFAAFHLDVDGGIEVTASHNPMDYNGMKLVARGARPISGDTGLKAIQELAEANQFAAPIRRGTLTQSSNPRSLCYALGFLLASPVIFNGSLLGGQGQDKSPLKCQQVIDLLARTKHRKLGSCSFGPKWDGISSNRTGLQTIGGLTNDWRFFHARFVDRRTKPTRK